MIAALDIETIPNRDMIPRLPEPKIDSRLKDAAKIAEAKKKAKDKQIADMALDPLTGRVLCFSLVNDDADFEMIIQEPTDAQEITLLQEIFGTLGNPETRLVTFNGIWFDLPYIYKRAAILGVNPANFGAPPLKAWTKRYSTDRHYDLMCIWYGWGPPQKGNDLDKLSSLILGTPKDEEIPYDQFLEVMKTEEGRKRLTQECTQHTRLTWRLFKQMLGTLFV